MGMTAFLLRLADYLPSRTRGFVTEARLGLLTQFLMFGVVGLFGFTLDTLTVYALRHDMGLYAAGMAGYVSGATGTWFCNRLWTFRGQSSGMTWYAQWGRFMMANLPGFAINRGLYVVLITFVGAAAREPVIAVFAGAIAGMTLNFNLSRKMVFR